MKRVCVTMRGMSSEWGLLLDMSQMQIDAMRADGIEVNEVVNTIPMWAVETGLTTPWCFIQDVFNFRNPFSRRSGS